MKPTKEAIVLGRLAYGHNAADLERLGRAGLKRWLDEQLAPPEGDDGHGRGRAGGEQERREVAGQHQPEGEEREGGTQLAHGGRGGPGVRRGGRILNRRAARAP